MIIQTTKLPTITKIMYCNSTKCLIVILPYKCVLFYTPTTRTMDLYYGGIHTCTVYWSSSWPFISLKCVNLLEVITDLLYIPLLITFIKHSLLPDWVVLSFKKRQRVMELSM